MSAHFLLLAASALSFGLSAFKVPSPKFDFFSAGFMFVVLSLIF